jgi:hypothetical protein
MTLNLSLPTDREKLETLIADDVELFCQTYYEQGHRNHLGASEVGEPCWRKLWYSFRWCKLEHFSGRMMRLFNVGHSAEPRFITYLRGIGFEVREFDENGKQFRISGAMGHYGGSLDGMCKAPERYQLETDLVLLNEFKTNATGPGYVKVDTEGLAKAKPKHWAQMCQYGVAKGIRYGLYMIENKNDSDITFKIVELDWNYGKQLADKAQQIIFAKEPPPRISENPAMFDCKWCDKIDICHKGAKPEKNCRSCRNAEPVENAEWKCLLHNANIPSDFVKVGCDQWNPI